MVDNDKNQTPNNLNKPMIVRRIYTKAWNDTTYQRYRFPGIKILDDPTESGSRGLH